MKSVIWHLIAGTRGGITRGRIITLLRQTPGNANKIAETLHLDYKTVRHHLEILEKNNIIYAIAKKHYGAGYFLTESMQSHIKEFEKILVQFGNNVGKN